MITNLLESIQGYVAYNKESQSIYVVFRGSVDSINIIEDADFSRKQYPGGPVGALVHTGFYDAYQTVSSQVITAVNNLL